MLDRLKEARYRRRFGSERGPLVLRIERAMRDLPAEALSHAWIEWLWRQPPETWEDAIGRRRGGERIPGEPGLDRLTPKEFAALIEELKAENARIIAATERNVAALGAASGQVTKAADAMAKAQSAVKKRQRIARRRREAQKIDDAFSKALQACETLRSQVSSPPVVSRPARWQDWIDALPLDAREEAIQIRTLFALMERVQRALSDALTIRRSPDSTPETIADVSKRIEALRPWVRACHREYEELAEPFFERHGRPDLTEG